MTDVNKLITDNIDVWTSAIKKRNSQGRGSNKKIELIGVKKLRELILELAVSGKLVEQDSRDEPPSVLLEKIAEEKTQLIKDKKIKKQKPLPAITDEEKPFAIPLGWEWSRLGFATNYGSSDKAEPLSVEANTWVLELEDVEKSTSKLLKKVRYNEREFKSSKNKFLEGDVIYGKLRPYLDKVIVANESGVCTTEMIPVRAYSSILPEFLRLIMKAPYFIKYANESTHGMNLPRMGTDKARLALIPILSLAEQQRIVAKVDELMAFCAQLEQQTEQSLTAHQTLVEVLLAALTNCDSTEDFQTSWQRIAEHFDVLFTTEHSIEQLKQTILQLAVMGKLVPQNQNDEPASVLLEKIAAEKAQLIVDKKIKKQKPLSAIIDEEKPFELPDNWAWSRLGEQCKLVTSGSRGWKSYYADVGSTFIRSQDIKYDRIEFDNRAYVDLPESTEGKRTEVELNDMLMTITGANVAKCAVVNTEIDDAYVSQHVALIKLIRKDVNRFIHTWITGSHGGRKQLLECSYGAKPGLNLQNINELLIPLPPIEEQYRIVVKVDELMALCEQLKTRLSDAQTTQLHLADAVVEYALNK
jgi:type I restriction enzyme S subunit